MGKLLSIHIRDIGGGFAGMLTVAFIVLKLIGEISWSWLWVLSPLWIPLIIVIISYLIILLIGGLIWWLFS